MRMLERYEGAPVEALRLATRQALVRLVDGAISQRVDFVVLAGDIYDGDWRDYNTGLFFVAQIDRLTQAQIPVVMIAGNHDAANKMTRQLRLPTGATLLAADEPGSVLFEDLGVAIHGQSFASAAVTENLARHYPEPIAGMFNLGLLHTCAEGREGHDRYAPCTVEELRRKGYDYWALGHIHQHEILAADPLIVFPGNTQGRSIRELGEKGCVLVRSDGLQPPQATRVPLHSAQWEQLRLRIGPDSTVDSVLQEAGESMAEYVRPSPDLAYVVRVRLEGDWPAGEKGLSHEEWEAELRSLSARQGNGRVWIEKVRFDRRGSASDEVCRPTHDDGAMGVVLDQVARLRESPSAQAIFRESIEELMKSLPQELRSEWTEQQPQEEWLARAMDDVPNLLQEYFDREGGTG
jgi:DNA repair exonuclease SbcCD nuclease subunit